MFTTNISIALFAGLIFSIGLNPFSCLKARAQQEDKIFVISDRVGEVIDIEERNYYQLFPNIQGFQSAEFVQMPDSTFEVKILYLEDQTEKTRIRKLPASEIEGIRESIDHFEEFLIGTYEPVIGLPKFKSKVKSRKIYVQPTQLKPVKVAGEFILGSVGSLLGGLVGMATWGEGEISDDYLDGYGVGFLIGSTVGSSITVYLIGTLGEETGSFRNTCLGSLVGTVIGTGLICALYNEITYDRLLQCNGFILVQSAGATLAFNKTRMRVMIVPEESLLNYKKGKWNLCYPQISIKPNPLRTGDWIKTVSLVSFEF